LTHQAGCQTNPPKADEKTDYADGDALALEEDMIEGEVYRLKQL
jgi:hypothetical protein